MESESIANDACALGRTDAYVRCPDSSDWATFYEAVASPLKSKLSKCCKLKEFHLYLPNDTRKSLMLPNCQAKPIATYVLNS